MEWLTVLENYGTELIGPTPWLVVWSLVKIVVIAVPIILCVAYLTYWERKMIGAMHARRGPNRVGYRGLLQPFADVFKLLTKEVIIPNKANKVLYILAPRSEEHTSELQSLMRISYAVFCLKKKNKTKPRTKN